MRLTRHRLAQIQMTMWYKVIKAYQYKIFKIGGH